MITLFKKNIGTICFLGITSILLYIYLLNYNPGNLLILVSYLTCILFIKIFCRFDKQNENVIISSKACIFNFLFCYVITNSFIVAVAFSKIPDIYVFLFEVIIFFSIFICYLRKFKLSYFNWDINLKSFLVVVVAFIIYNIIAHKFSLNQFTINGIVSYLPIFIYPAIPEEVIFRGFLMSGLRYLKISEKSANIIQAVLFGIMHFGQYTAFGPLAIIGVCDQILAGYILGCIYLHFKSLLPCVILHALINAFE